MLPFIKIKMHIGGRVSDSELIPIQLDENSPTEFITENEAVNIIKNEVNRQVNHFELASDNEKEEIIANLLIQQVRQNPSVLDDEVVQCTLNKTIYQLLRTFYLPDSVSKTIASWIAWFIRGAGKITFAFVKSTYNYLLTNYQRLLLIATAYLIWWFVTIPLDARMYKYYVALMNPAPDITLAEGHDWIGTVITYIVTKTYGDVVTNLSFSVMVVQGIASLFSLGKFMVDYGLELKENISTITANCIVSRSVIQKSPITKGKIELQVLDAFKSLNKTSAVKKGIHDSKHLKNIPLSDIEEQFVHHVKKSIEMTPISQITKIVDMPVIDKISPDEYLTDIVQYSVKLADDLGVPPPGLNERDNAIAKPKANTDSVDEATGLPLLQFAPHAEIPDKYSVNIADTLGLSNEHKYKSTGNIVQNISRKLDNQFSIILA